MKNLFKNLMLVAVAAMAFTACSQDVNDVNGVEKKYTISGVATIENEDTRSGFVGKNEAGDAYVSEWDGDEYIRLYFSVGGSAFTEIDAEGTFEYKYIGDYSGTTATVCSPDDAWYNVNEYVIPDPQTPRENSVDPMAHILKSDATEIINGTLSVKMKHAVAYGNVSFPELSLDGDAVKNVVLDIDGAEYTINTSATQNIWFACEPNGTVSNMTVTVNTNGGQALYKKIIENGDKNLSFDKGIVSTFNVKGLEQKPTEPEQPAEPEVVAFNSATVTPADDGLNYHYITFTDGTYNAIIKLATRGTTEYVAGLYDQNGSFSDATSLYIGGYSSDCTWNGAECWPVTMEVIDNGDGTATFNLVYNELPSAVQHKGTYTGVLEGLTLVEPKVPETGDVTTYTIQKIAVGYDQPGEKEVQFWYSATNAHVIDFKGFNNCTPGKPLAAGTYSSEAYTIDASYCIYDYGTTNGTMSDVECVVTDNGDGTYTYDAKFTYNGQKYAFVYTGAYPA